MIRSANPEAIRRQGLEEASRRAIWDVAYADGRREVSPTEVLVPVALFVALPYGEELVRCARARCT